MIRSNLIHDENIGYELSSQKHTSESLYLVDIYSFDDSYRVGIFNSLELIKSAIYKIIESNKQYVESCNSFVELLDKTVDEKNEIKLDLIAKSSLIYNEVIYSYNPYNNVHSYTTCPDCQIDGWTIVITPCNPVNSFDEPVKNNNRIVPCNNEESIKEFKRELNYVLNMDYEDENE